MSLIAALIAKLTGATLKAGGEAIKLATEIPKNVIETEKAHLEVQRLRHERETQTRLIVPATFEDVKQFDPKYQQIRSKLPQPYIAQPKNSSKKSYVVLAVILLSSAVVLAFTPLAPLSAIPLAIAGLIFLFVTSAKRSSRR